MTDELTAEQVEALAAVEAESTPAREARFVVAVEHAIEVGLDLTTIGDYLGTTKANVSSRLSSTRRRVQQRAGD